MQNNNDKIIELLEKEYGAESCGLDFGDPFQLLIATILSAQCTDVKVNQVTPKLFEAFPGPSDFAALQPEDLYPYIQSCGLYKTKAKNIVNTCRILSEEYDCEVPREREALESLPGVGRKTANVVLSNAFGIAAIAVDTHVFRVSNRLGLADAKNELETEKDLMRNIPEDKWSAAHHWIIWHGRRVCSSQKPKCGDCVLSAYCRYHNENKNEKEDKR